MLIKIDDRFIGSAFSFQFSLKWLARTRNLLAYAMRFLFYICNGMQRKGKSSKDQNRSKADDKKSQSVKEEHLSANADALRLDKEATCKVL